LISVWEVHITLGIKIAIVRPSSTFSTFYLALLLLELAVVTYDGLFTDSSFGQWVRIVVLSLAIFGFYCWKTGLLLSWKWAWRVVFLLTSAWFFIYIPIVLYRDWHLVSQMIDELGLSMIAPGYLLVYAFHLPLLYVLYSSGFREPAVRSNSVAALDA
jgi:hypothetical protein